MKTALVILGVVFLLLLLAVGGYYGFKAYEESKYDISSKAFVDEAVPAIAASWSKDELIQRESPGLQTANSDDRITDLFAKLSQLGPLQKYLGSSGESNVHLGRHGLLVTAHYAAQATCQNGKIEVGMELILINDQWKIFRFQVRPATN